MFKDISINLTGPLCTCPDQNLSWGIEASSDGNGMRIVCKTCKTKLVIPYDKFVAGFKLEVPYPGPPKKKVEEPKEAKSVTEYKTNGEKVGTVLYPKFGPSTDDSFSL